MNFTSVERINALYCILVARTNTKIEQSLGGEVARLPLSETDISRRQVLTTLGSSAHQWKAPRPSQGNKQAITQLHRSINEVLLYFTVLTYFISVTSQAKAKEISE